VGYITYEDFGSHNDQTLNGQEFHMSFTLPDLPYAFDALEPHIDARTMEIHHGKHHAAYVANANKALAGTSWADKSVEEVLTHLGDLPADIQMAVKNNAGGHANHSLFWTILAPAGSGGGGKPSGALAAEIDKVWGSFDGFKEAFGKAAATRFGSGWAWAGLDAKGVLHVGSTANQDSPISIGHTAILGLDVWEHAYYLNYQNRRPDYIASFWNIVNWAEVGRRFDQARG
jgi:superoxide dismutase, Fe-Mn family